MAELIQGLDGPRTDGQELFYDLEDSSAILGWVIAELTKVVERTNPPGEAASLEKICELMSVEQAKLRGYADEVKAGRIVRGKAE